MFFRLPAFFVLCREKVLSLHIKNFCIMKSRLFVIVMLAAVTAGVVSCNGGQKQPTQYAVTLEPLTSMDKQPQLDLAASAVWWDDAMEAKMATVRKSDEGAVVVRDDTTATQGIVRMVYPANVPLAGAGCVDICQHQLPTGKGMVYYGETTEDAPDQMVLKAVCGVLRLHLITAEKIANVTFETADSNRYMTGVFEVSNYPFPVLTATKQSLRSVVLESLQDIDFTQGAEVCAYVAPGCFHTFTVIMTTVDGRVCTKNLKEGREVLVDRNRTMTVNLGSQEEPLVFE